MKALIVSDHEPTSSQVRQALLREGFDTHAAPLGRAEEHFAAAPPDLVVVTLSPDPEKALGALALVRPLTQARLLAMGPTADPKLMLRALRAGADDFLDEADAGVEMAGAVSRKRTGEFPAAGRELGRVIGVLSASGGSGASTLAANIATALAKEHKRAGLMDLKLEAGDLAALLDLKPTHSIADLCQNAARMDRVMFERSLVAHSSGVQLLGAPRLFADIASVTPEGVLQALGLARSLFPYVVADLDHPSRPEQLHVLRAAEIVLLVMRLDFPSLRNARRTLDYLQDQGIDTTERVRLVVNRYGQAKEIPYGKAEEALGRKIFHYVPDDPKTINRANNSGIPVVLESPSAKVSRSVLTLAANVNGRHKSNK
jgi:pilus assembly protein CpaE